MHAPTTTMATATLIVGGLSALAMAAPNPAAAAVAAAASAAHRAPLIQPRNSNLIADKYIVKMRRGTNRGTMSAAIANIAAKADYTYERLNGFAGTLTADEVKLLQDHPSVEYIEQDATVRALPFPDSSSSSLSSSSSASYYTPREGPSSSSSSSSSKGLAPETETEDDAPWGLSRLSSTSPGASSYTYSTTSGSGTCAYVLDTGIDVTHPEFEGRAVWLENFASGSSDKDGVGHGTHVAGTIGSASFGVSKKTTLFAVKVLGDDGSGTNSGVIAGMEYVVTDSPQRECPKGVVVNMSLGGSHSETVNAAAKEITSSGIFLAVAAGNEAADAESSSPAGEESACTVGATDDDDSFAYYSNFGKVVDVLAPGSDILSTWPAGKTNTISGTSMATPHIAGLGAYFLGEGAAEADGLCEYIASLAQEGPIKGVPAGTVNMIAQNGEA